MGCDTLHPHQMVDTQFGITIMGGREVSRPYRVWFFAEGEQFLSTEPVYFIGTVSPQKIRKPWFEMNQTDGFQHLLFPLALITKTKRHRT